MRKDAGQYRYGTAPLAELSLRFTAQQELAYRIEQDRRYKIQRVIFFAVCSLSWLIGAFLNDGFFHVREDTRGLLLLIELAWAVPVLALTSIMPMISRNRRWIYPCNVAGTVTLWGAVFCMHALAQFGAINYPIHMLSISVMAVAFFCGFRFRPMMVGSTISMTLGVIVVGLGEQAVYPLGMYLYETFYLWIIAIAGLSAIELLNRSGFLYRQHIENLARTDGLTGLMNRRAFEYQFKIAMGQAARDRKYVAVALLDLDHFKALNDRYGHAIGDEALRMTGDALSQPCCGARAMDLRARYGGEEFVVMWYDLSPLAATSLGQRLLKAMREIRVPRTGAAALQITASVGIHCAIPDAATQADQFLELADRALYQAKAAGRDQYMINDSSQQ